MAYYANQKTVVIQREAVDSKGGKQFLMVYSENLAEAARNLNGAALKLYLYFLSNTDGYHKDFSPQHFCNIYGCSRSSAARAFDELVEQNYIIQEGSKYYFYERPQETAEIIVEPERRIVKTTKGSKVMTYTEFYNQLCDKHSEVDILNTWNSLEVTSND